MCIGFCKYYYYYYYYLLHKILSFFNKIDYILLKTPIKSISNMTGCDTRANDVLECVFDNGVYNTMDINDDELASCINSDDDTDIRDNSEKIRDLENMFREKIEIIQGDLITANNMSCDAFINSQEDIKFIEILREKYEILSAEVSENKKINICINKNITSLLFPLTILSGIVIGQSIALLALQLKKK